METTPLHTVNYSSVLSESQRIFKANYIHFFALALFFLPLSISIVVIPTLHPQVSGSFFTGNLFHSFILSDPIPIVLHLLYILIVYLLTFCGVATISYSTHHVLLGKPVNYFASLKSLTFSFLPLISTAVLAHTIMFLISVALLLFGGMIVMLGKSFGFEIGFYWIILIRFSIIITIIYFQTNWCLALMVVVAESNWGVSALKRSWYLVKGMRSVLLSIFLWYFLMFFWSWAWWFSNTVHLIAFSILVGILFTIIGFFLPMMWSVDIAVLYMKCKALHGELSPEIDEGFDHQYINLPSNDDMVNHVDVVTVLEA